MPKSSAGDSRLALMLGVLRTYVDGALMTPEQHEAWLRSQDPTDPGARRLEHVLRTRAVEARVQQERDLQAALELERLWEPERKRLAREREAEREARLRAWREERRDARIRRDALALVAAQEDKRVRRAKAAKPVKSRMVAGAGGSRKLCDEAEYWAASLYEDPGGPVRELNFDHA